ncbi:RHS repeat-associated core domain-containing protein [Pseudomonas agarici]|nr:RHS repeat-associated core domain-containing protein [Pseudomonas agarici]
MVEHAYNPIHRRYQYDPAGELTRTLDKLRGEIKYEYEANGQLHSRDTGQLVDSEEFRYDAAANRLNFSTSQFDHVKDNRIKQWRDQEYSYDAWGNLVEKRIGLTTLQTFSYDCENRLVKAETLVNSKLGSVGTYRYDSLGRRVGKTSTVDGNTQHKNFLWQGLRMLREESPQQSSLYIYEPGSYAPLARVDHSEGQEQKLYYFHTDQIGTPLEMTDVEGQIVWQATYKAWGSIETLAVNEVEQNLRFQGQYFDEETGLHYNTFRYYDPQVGRFITQDPIGLAGGDNLYRYAPSAVGWVDPLGLCSKALSSNMTKAGTPRPANSAAHHIVGDTSKLANPARKVLAKHDINVDDAVNGVFLPNRNNIDPALPGILHNGKHPNSYFESVNELIVNADKAGGKPMVLKTIDKVRSTLLASLRDAQWSGLFG